MATLTLPDGRLLAYATTGDPGGAAVLILHGTPGSSRQVASLSGPARERGLRLIAPDRAGYGGSTYDPARTIGSSARDLGERIRHERLDGCAVAGLSGGGPTALACGILLPGLVRSVTTVGSVGPLVPRDPSLPPDRMVIRTARRSERAATMLFAAMVFTSRRSPEKALGQFADLLAEPDARLLREDAGIRDAFIDDLRHPAPTAARAAARDFWLFGRQWDVDLAAMAVPAHIWHGTQDRNVPVAHARVLAARCPAARLHIVDGGGHMLLSSLDDILASVAGPIA